MHITSTYGNKYMQSRMIAVSFGVAIVAFLPQLPSLNTLTALLLCLGLLLLLRRPRRGRVLVTGLFCVCLGLGYSTYYGQQLLQSRLDPSSEDQPFQVTGYITGLPKTRTSYQAASTQFEFKLIDDQLPLRKVLLHWREAPLLQPGQIWRIKVKLRQPRGLANHKGFDYMQWLVVRGLDAKGVVLTSGNNQLLGHKLFSIDFYRNSLANYLQQQLPQIEHIGLIKALLIADKRQVSRQQWQLFINTGTIHLFAISGLHIGIMAGIGFYFGRLLALCLRLPMHKTSASAAIVFAWFYAAAAGFSIPTLRALVMVLVFMLSQLTARHIPLGQRFFAALLACLLIHPLSVLSGSFWFSFLAVAAILLLCVGHKGQLSKLLALVKAQYAVFIVLTPLTIYFFNLWAWGAFATNLIVLPVFSFVLLPLIFIALFFTSMGLDGLWHGVDALFDGLFYLLNVMQSLQGYSTVAARPWYGLFFVLPLMLILLVRYHPAKCLALFLPLALLLPKHSKTEGLRIHAFDVGQGLAVLLRIDNKALLFDTGAYWDDSGVVDTVITPYLKSLGLTQLDVLVISHGDNDHAGGAKRLLAELPVKHLYLGERLPNATGDICRQQSWAWGGAQFQFISRDHKAHEQGNNASCVLKVSYGDKALLLTGDIERSAELGLVKCCSTQLNSTVLFAPHHGSLSSSSWPFIKRVSPDWVLYSTGYNNRFNHPANTVARRYQAIGAQALNTAKDGAVDMYLPEKGEIAVKALRWQRSYYWQ